MAPRAAGTEEDSGNFKKASSMWPKNAPFTEHVKEVAHHHVHEKQKWMQAGGVMPSEVETVEGHRTIKVHLRH